MTAIDELGAARGVTGGVDTHADVHVCVAVCTASLHRLGAAPFPVTALGYRQLLEWLQDFGAVDHVGIEGTGTYGAGLARFLTAGGVPVIEV